MGSVSYGSSRQNVSQLLVQNLGGLDRDLIFSMCEISLCTRTSLSLGVIPKGVILVRRMVVQVPGREQVTNGMHCLKRTKNKHVFTDAANLQQPQQQ